MSRSILIVCIVIALSAMIACGDSNPSDGVNGQGLSEIELINEQIAENPKSHEAIAARARFHYANQNYIDAVYDVAKAMQLDSLNEEYHHLLADIYLDTYKSELALRTMERSIRLFPNSIASNLKIAELQIILKQYSQASASLRRVMETEPNNIDALLLLGILFQEQGELTKATQSFQRVVDLDGDNYEAWTMLGNLLDIQDDPLALQCFENAITIDSNYVQGWHSKAFYLQNHGNVDEAILIYNKIHRIDPNYIDAYTNAGILYLEKEEFDSAEIEFTALVAISPSYPLGPFYLGVVAEAKGDKQTALTNYRTASALSPRNARFAEAVERIEFEVNN